MTSTIEIALHAATVDIGKAIYVTVGKNGPLLMGFIEKKDGKFAADFDREAIDKVGIKLDRLMNIVGTSLHEVVESKELPPEFTHLATKVLEELALAVASAIVLSMLKKAADKTDIKVPNHTPPEEAN